jgi:hypothetical protein
MSEGGKELMGADALTAIRTFAGMGKLFKAPDPARPFTADPS